MTLPVLGYLMLAGIGLMSPGAHSQTALVVAPVTEPSDYSLRVVASPLSAAERSYQQGLRAYLREDYAQAQQQWMVAARSKHPHALFNLGFLHEQSKVTDASLVAAQQWYELAGKAGYAAAYYHLAMTRLASNPHDKEGRAHLRQAAQQRYRPAIARLAQLADDVITPESESHTLASSHTLRRALWINAQDASYWTIQLLAFSELAAVYAFMEQHQLQASAAYFQDTSSSPSLYKVIFGAYPSKDQATLALRALPPELTAQRPWLRSFASVQAILGSMN